MLCMHIYPKHNLLPANKVTFLSPSLPLSLFNHTLCLAAIFRLAMTTDYANREYFLADTDNANSLISFECNMPHATLPLVMLTDRQTDQVRNALL